MKNTRGDSLLFRDDKIRNLRDFSIVPGFWVVNPAVPGIEKEIGTGTISPGVLQFLFISQVNKAPCSKDNNDAYSHQDPPGDAS